MTTEAAGSEAYPFLEKLRAELHEIDQLLQKPGVIDVSSIPNYVPIFREGADKLHHAAKKCLIKQKSVLFGQLCTLVEASKDPREYQQLLKRARQEIHAIEVYYKARLSGMRTEVPRCIIGYKDKYGSLDGTAVSEYFYLLKDHEFRIVLLDMKAAVALQETVNATGAEPIDHVAAIALLPEMEELSILDPPPSFSESQNAHR
ncbi:hypothetical protein BG004_007323 [Podila humilis]|nr:hypothetical protein BG004_007323 [Podila humilis]